MSTREERDARLTTLENAVNEWGIKERGRLEAEVSFLKSIINKRTGAGRLANQGISDSKDILVQKIGEFLEG
jgi:uncharacterized membrane protein